ncbi:MAG: hypothetical protein ABFD92_21660 [Planctomycetaceae bacterium]
MKHDNDFAGPWDFILHVVFALFALLLWALIGSTALSTDYVWWSADYRFYDPSPILVRPAITPVRSAIRWVTVPRLRVPRDLCDDPSAHGGGNYDAHEDSHGVQGRLRQQYPGHEAVYLMHGRAALIPVPRFTLTAVARAIPERLRGKRYGLYLVQQARAGWDNEPTYVLNEWSCYINGLECDILRRDRANIRHGIEVCREFEAYARTLLDIARSTPDYDAEPLAALIEYQSARLQRMIVGVPPAAAVNTPTGQPAAPRASMPREYSVPAAVPRLAAPGGCPGGQCPTPGAQGTQGIQWQPLLRRAR